MFPVMTLSLALSNPVFENENDEKMNMQRILLTIFDLLC